MQTKLISDKPQIRYQTAHLYNRPKRIAYVVNRSIATGLLRDVLKYNTSILGGQYNLFVPSDGKHIREDWRCLLLEYDPDAILYVGDIEQALHKILFNAIQPFVHNLWDDGFIEYLESANRGQFGLSAITLIGHHYNKSKGIVEADKSNCVYPIINDDNEYANYFHIAFGDYAVQKYTDAYQEVLSAKEINCAPQNLAEYLSLHDEFKSKMTPLKFSTWGFKPLYTNAIGAPTIVLDSGSADNLFLFHLLSWVREKVIIPHKSLSNNDDYKALADWINRNISNSNYFHLVNADADLQPLREVRQRLKPFLPDRFKNVDLKSCNFESYFPKVYDRIIEQQVRIEGRKRTFAVPELDLAVSTQKTTGWIVELDLAPQWLVREGFLPSKFPDMPNLLSEGSITRFRDPRFYSGSPNIRVSRESIAIEASRYQTRTIELPTPEDLFTLLFEHCRWTVRKDEKGSYYQGMIKLAGGLSAMSILREEISSNFFKNKELLSGEALTINQMLNHFKLGQRKIELGEIVSDLALQSILLRGYNLRCANCDLIRWYSIKDGNERMVCQGCLSEFQMSPDTVQSFRLNELFIRGLEQGGRTVLLTLMVLKSIVEKSLIWDVGYKVSNSDGEIDIDFVAMCDGHLVMGECKDSLSNSDEIIEQLTRDIRVGQNAGAAFFVLATSDPDIPPHIRDFIDNYEKETGTYICIFKQEDLERGSLRNSENRPIFINHMLKRCTYEQKCLDSDKNNNSQPRTMSF